MVVWLLLAAAGCRSQAPETAGGTPEAPAFEDPLLREPYVDVDEWRDTPVPHRYVHGGFEGTEARFSIYFPPQEQYDGRFFQYVTPIPIDETQGTTGGGTGDQVRFAFAGGAYFLVTNQGGMGALFSDPTLGAYRVNAAAAQYSRTLAQEFYGPHRVYGYAYGGSGGAYRTIGGVENTVGVWDGSVPYVPGCPYALPSVYTVRLLALRVLRDDFPQIVDALEPGGSGDPYAGLDEEERSVLQEVTRMGFPLPSWVNYDSLGLSAFSVIFPMVVARDPAYFEEFWKTPGYAGADPPPSLLRDRIRHATTVKAVLTRPLGEAEAPGGGAEGREGGVDTAWHRLEGEPVGVELESIPRGEWVMAKVLVESGTAAGASFLVERVEGNSIFVRSAAAAQLSGERPPGEILRQVRPGDRIVVDNSDILAVQYYHRHQVPPSLEFRAWDQFRDAEGNPLYPQRPELLGPQFAAAAGGSTQTGRIGGKMIVVAALWDQDAFPWQAEWYASKVRQALGPEFDDRFRLWFVDRALHGDVEEQADPTQTVSYIGALQQALRDLSAWVEKGVPPPASTVCDFVAGQPQLPSRAAERKGVQPVVTLTADGGSRAEVRAGDTVRLQAVIEVPPGAGRVVAVEWSPAGDGTFEPGEFTAENSDASRVVATTAAAYPQPGTYFAVVRATLQREGDPDTPFGRIQNLARARVVVK